MSFWDEIKNFTKPYNDDEDYDDYDDEMDDSFEEEAPQPERTPRFGRREAAPAQEPAFTPAVNNTTTFTPASTGFNGQVLNMGASASNKQEVVLFRPGTFNDTSKAADDLRNRKAVIVNMENVDKAMARRVVDFLSGCVYALDGDVKKIAQSAYLFCPHNMDIVGDLETLQAEVESYI